MERSLWHNLRAGIQNLRVKNENGEYTRRDLLDLLD